MLFTMYVRPLSAIIGSLSTTHHSFGDDLQLQMSSPRINYLSYFTLCSYAYVMSKLCQLRTCSSSLTTRQNSIFVTSRGTKHLHSLPTSITIGNAQIPFKQSVKNLGFTLDCHLTMNAHVSNIARTCYFELRRLASIRRFMTSTATATLVSAFVLSRIDYYGSLLFGSTLDVTELRSSSNLAPSKVI